MNGCSLQQVLRQNLCWFLSYHWKTPILRANRESIGSSKKWYQDFQNNPPFQRSACFYVAISGNFKRFQHSNFETDFLENGSLFQKTGVPFFSWISTKIENVSLPYKTVYQKPMVRQIEWWVQNGSITKNGVLPVTALFILKI